MSVISRKNMCVRDCACACVFVYTCVYPPVCACVCALVCVCMHAYGPVCVCACVCVGDLTTLEREIEELDDEITLGALQDQVQVV